MDTRIPDELKADVPQTTFGKVLGATPVVMAVIATMLAGLSSSEMTRAQYDRALGAQQQSKAGDQWSFFQAKRLRGALQDHTADLLAATTELHPLDPAAVRSAAERQPPLAAEAAPDPRVKATLAGLEQYATAPQMAALLAPLDDAVVAQAFGAAHDRTQAFDTATKPVNEAIARMEDLRAKQAARERAPSLRELSRDFAAVRLRHAALRYETEARLNQAIANVHEREVRRSNLSAERHHRRSQQCLFGMLGAQLGVIVATFALAARNRSLLWALAASAGLVAVGFAVYVYLRV
jgi:hypothetical protein